LRLLPLSLVVDLIKRRKYIEGAYKIMFKRLISSSGIFSGSDCLQTCCLQVRRFLCGLAAPLRSEKGVSMMEVVVSILIFGILLTTAVTIIRFSLVITGDAINRATVAQDMVNDLMVSDDLPSDGVIYFSFNCYATGVPVSRVSSHDVEYSDADGFLVFRPAD